MKNIIFLTCTFLLLTTSSVLNGKTPESSDQCFICHEQLGGVADQFKKDVHFQKGISCAGCHGGDSKSDDMEKAMSKSAGFLGIPKGDDISLRCANCHAKKEMMQKYGSHLPTNQLELLKASVHGKLSTNGKEKIVQCITCHNAHGIVSVKNPASPVYPLNVPNTCGKCHSNAKFMQTYNPSLAVDQVAKYRTSVHGMLNAKGDPKPAECASCHGSHGIRATKDAKSQVYALNIPETCSKCHSDAQYMAGYKIPTDQYAKFAKSVHGKALLEKHDVGAPACNSCHGNHGATPPGVESISKVCGTCHALNADLFSSSPHKQAFDKEKLPECETCHNNHEIMPATKAMLGVDKDAVCSKCHTETKSTKGYLVAKQMRSYIDSLETSEALAQKLINDAEQKGMEISETKFKLRDAHQAKLEARTMVHSFSEQKFKDVVVGKGLSVTSASITEAKEAVDNYFFRRYGLMVSVLIISILSFALYLYIKQIEKKQAETRS